MKKSILFSLGLFACFSTFAQVEVDKPIQLTGSGSDAKVTGIDNVSAPKDAVSAEVVQSNALSYSSAGGVANAYTVALAPAVASYVTGQLLSFLANAQNTGISSVNVNGLGAITIKKNGDTDLVAGDIKNGQVVTVIYDGTNFQMVSQIGNAPSGGGGGGAGDDVRTLIYTTDGF